VKVGIVGSGFVGATAAYAMMLRGVGREIVLIDLNSARAKAEADDISHAAPFTHPVHVYAGDYADLAGSSVVVITAGVGQKPGESRLQLLERNAAVFRQIIPRILTHAPNAVLIVTTNPVDVMTHLAARYAAAQGVPPSHVIGSGTVLDTARFQSLLGRYLDVDPHHIHGYVLGEHGDSEVVAWSSVRVGSLSLEAFSKKRGVMLDKAIRQEIVHRVRDAAYSIIEGKGATYYGIGAALADIVDVILDNRRSIMTVCTPMPDVVGVPDVTVSLPHLVGGKGIISSFPPSNLHEDEMNLLKQSASVIKQAIDELDEAEASHAEDDA
jgi:L-lactate dehydrogenase